MRSLTVACTIALSLLSSSLFAQEESVAAPDVDARLLFAENCAGCHGPDGGGSDEVAGLETAIKSYGAPAEAWRHQPTFDGVLAALAGGVPGTPMHGFEGFSDAERRALAGYVMGLRAALLDEPSTTEPADEPVVTPEPPVVTESSDREMDMFGESTQPAAADVPSREEDMFGDSGSADVPPEETGGLSGAVLTDAAIDERLAEKQDPLAIGAMLFLQFQYAALEKGDAGEFALTAPSLLDLYVDGRPNDRVRAYARARLATNPTIPEGSTDLFGDELETTTVKLDQLWLKFDLWRAAFVTVGKQRIKWGTGRFWNPTDFLNNERLDPLQVAVFDERLGVTLAKLHVPVEALGWNFYAIATLDDAETPEDVGGALRAEVLFGLTEATLSAAFRKNNPWRLGADISTGVWLFDVRLEAALLHNDERAFYRGEFELPATLPEEYSREDDWIPQIVGGAEVQVQYNDEDTLFVGAEYFYNDAGYEDSSLYLWLFANQAFTPFYVGQHYAAVYALLAAPGSWNDTNFTVSGLGNLSDRSFIARVDVSQTVLTYLRWNVFANTHFGERGEFRYGVEIEPNPFLPDGASVVPPRVELGAGLRLTL